MVTFLVEDINTNTKKREFPDKRKTAQITPAFKKDDTNDKSSYRLVNILSILSKVYEKCFYKHIKNYMENELHNF